MEEVIFTRKTNIIHLMKNDRSVWFDLQFGELDYPFFLNFCNVNLSDKLIAELESSKILTVETKLCRKEEFHCNQHTDIYVKPRFGYTTEKVTAILIDILNRMDNE